MPPQIPKTIRPFRIAVLVDTSTSWGRNVCKGIQKYGNEHGRWHIFLDPHGIEEEMRLPKGWKGEGVIARIRNEAMSRDLAAAKMPTVNICGFSLPGTTFPRVATDLTTSARLAARYFLDRGFRQFAYLGTPELDYFDAYQHAFIQELDDAGAKCKILPYHIQPGAESNWYLNFKTMGKWLKDIPKPLAIVTWNSREILFACHISNISVPEEVAILATNDDDLLCANANIPISAIEMPAEQIGYKAAEMLHRLLEGKKPKESIVLLPPTRVITRQSTDTISISDPALAKAIQLIRSDSASPISVNQLASHSGISRRALERKFLTVLGRSPGTEISRYRIERARELLISSDISTAEIAEATGFNTPQYFSLLFKKKFGITPSKYRRSFRNC